MIHGKKLLLSAAACRDSATLIAPYIKAHVLADLLQSIDQCVELKIYTRWRAEEVAAGVSDLEVFDLIDPRPTASLRLCDALHAKLYRFDHVVLIGSANLTNAALGWSRRPNIELLRRVKRSRYITTFEEWIYSKSVPATASLRDVVRKAAEELRRTNLVHWEGKNENANDGISRCWLPRLRRPQLLWKRYSNPSRQLTEAATDQYAADIASVGVVSGLDREALNACVRAVLLQHPFVIEIDNLVQTPQRFGAIRASIRSYLRKNRVDRDPTEATQTLIRWLIHFFPERYSLRTVNFSEILSRRA